MGGMRHLVAATQLLASPEVRGPRRVVKQACRIPPRGSPPEARKQGVRARQVGAASNSGAAGIRLFVFSGFSPPRFLPHPPLNPFRGRFCHAHPPQSAPFLQTWRLEGRGHECDGAPTDHSQDPSRPRGSVRQASQEGVAGGHARTRCSTWVHAGVGRPPPHPPPTT